MRVSPVLPFSTGDLKGLFTKLSNAESPMWKIAGAGVTAVWPLANPDAPGFASGSTHQQATIAAGQVWADGIEWSAGGAEGAIATARAFALSTDGITDPAPMTLVAAPTPVYSQSVYGLQSLTIGGNAIRAKSLSLAFGHGAENNDETACFNLDLPFPVNVKTPGAHGAIAHSLSIQTKDFVTAVGSAVVVAVFKDKALGGPGWGTNTVTVTMRCALALDGDRDDGAPGMRTIRGYGYHDGTNRPLTIA